MRLTLYQLRADGAIACPSTVLGALDVFDASTSDSAAVRAVASGGDGVPYVEYTIRRAVADSQSSADAAGWVSDGRRRLSFTVSAGPAPDVHGSDFALQLDDSAAGFHAMLHDAWQMGVDTYSDSIDLTVSGAGETIDLAGSTGWFNTYRSWDERVTVDGQPLAAVGGSMVPDGGQPTITSLQPAPLTGAEQQLIRDLVAEPGDLSQNLSRLLGLGGHLVPIRL